ncbi:GNAT family N-acetyltransferase [Paenibacillus sp. Marseille-Q4541]|uniref:GNAT family N-acetyltransferase n=1 Tax=Paenibacillus sp. Marseille-Q4541 TaxID=2831522 RepID=UPI001BABD1D6|nr:GNAT family N-acetyltransferase [Paenibacillus sp. Marseille-Q4541]
MEIRQLKVDEYEQSNSLSEYAFHYTLTPEQKEERKERFKPEQSWGIYEENVLQAKLTIVPFEVYLQGKVLHMGGIAGVATWPENRRKGHVSKLLKQALKVMKDKGQSLSFLHPFSIPFYRKYGWELYAEYKNYVIPAKQFPAKVEYPGKIVRDVKDLSVLDALYHSFACRYNGTLVRDEEWWKESVLQDFEHSAVYYSPEGEPQGYVLYELKDKELVCDEFVYLNEEARSALWTFFANHDSRIEQVKLIMVPGDDQFPYMLLDPRVTQETVPYFMGRIVDMESFLQQYTFETDKSSELTIQIDDPTAPWNTGIWSISINDKGQAQAKLLTLEEEINADLTGDIQTFSALFMGYKRPQQLFNMNKLQGQSQKVTELENLIPQGQTFLMDFF